MPHAGRSPKDENSRYYPGKWTAQYVAMRALGEPDAFPAGDLVIRRMMGDISARGDVVVGDCE